MGWNGSDRQSGPAVSNNQLESGQRSYRGLAAGAIVVVVGCAAMWWLVSGSGASSPAKADRRTSQIASHGSQQKASAVQPNKRKVVKTGDKVADALEEVKAEAELVKIEPQKDLPRQAKKSDRIFKTGVEQLMGFIMAVEPGNMPLPIGKISEDDRKNLVSILISKNEIADDDSEGIANLKENVDYCKKEMAKFIADGGEPNDFLQYYFQQLNTAFQTRNEVQSQYEDLREEDPELAKEFLEKANELLDQKGIKHVAAKDESGFGNWIQGSTGLKTGKEGLTHFANFESMDRRQVIGDTAVVEKGILTGWSEVFPEEGERFFASFAIPGVKAGQRNTTVDELNAALSRTVRVDETDSLEARQIKAMVEGMKREARAYIAAGGTVVEYGKRLTERQDAEIAIYERTKSEIEQAKKSLSGAALVSFWEQRNDALRNLGIKLVPLED